MQNPDPIDMDHLEPVRRNVRAAVAGPPPLPWRQITTIAIGGLTEIGFADDSELILVLSWQGRGVVDGETGDRLARDRSDDRVDWYGRDSLIARGFGPLDGRQIRLCGLWGGGLSTFTKDGWQAHSLTLEWPDEHLLLTEPHVDLYKTKAQLHKLRVERETRAFGFSPTGKTLVIATSSDLTIMGRA